MPVIRKVHLFFTQKSASIDIVFKIASRSEAQVLPDIALQHRVIHISGNSQPGVCN